MTVEELDKVDLVAGRADPLAVRLVISDHLDWDDQLGHLSLLQEKLNRYLAFVESGQLALKYPTYEGYPVQIEVAFQHAPTQHAQEHFLAKAREVVRGAGYEFAWAVRDAG